MQLNEWSTPQMLTWVWCQRRRCRPQLRSHHEPPAITSLPSVTVTFDRRPSPGGYTRNTGITHVRQSGAANCWSDVIELGSQARYVACSIRCPHLGGLRTHGCAKFGTMERYLTEFFCHAVVPRRYPQSWEGTWMSLPVWHLRRRQRS
jgi:hypothetical protein